MFVVENEADTEDVMGRSNYITLVNTCYNLPKSHKLPVQKPSNAPARVLEEVKNRFGTLPPKYPEFDHYTPALFLVSNTSDMLSALPELDQALERFEKLFEGLNKLLPKQGE